VRFEIRGRRVVFEKQVHDAHRKLRMRLRLFLRESNPRAVISTPFIYAMTVPFAIMDVSLTLYQAICFPLYEIPKVKRSDYVLLDRRHLAYLNFIERVNCTYCSYGNGVVAYLREISARTEQYWCPIKHAHKVLDAHPRYARFLPYGEADEFHAKLASYRAALRKEA
jgi:hypothetical protein